MPAFSFFGSDSRATPSPVRLRPTSPPVFEVEEAPRSSAQDLAPSQPQQNSLFQSFVPIRQPQPSPQVFRQNTVFSPLQPQPVSPVQQVRPAARPAARPAPRPAPAPVRPVQTRPAVRVQPQPAQTVLPTQPVAAPVRTNLFPSFDLPDFFSIPFAAFRSLTPSSGSNQQAAGPSQNPRAPQLFNSIGQ